MLGRYEVADYWVVVADYQVVSACYWRVNADEWLVSAYYYVGTADCLVHMKLRITGWL